MGYLGKGNAFLVLQFFEDGIADLVFSLVAVLYSAASPISVDFDAEILIFLEVTVELEGEVVFSVA